MSVIVALISVNVYAVSPLKGTIWKTIDDKNNKPVAIVKFNEESNGTLSATIQKILDKSAEEKCSQCKGKFKNKSLIGVTIVTNLKQIGNNKFDNGSIMDPETDKKYNFSATLSSDGKVLNGRGYLGVSLIGRNQTWYRIN